jgi:hypothetical protein
MAASGIDTVWGELTLPFPVPLYLNSQQPAQIILL